jgi:uncharacterized protein
MINYQKISLFLLIILPLIFLPALKTLGVEQKVYDQAALFTEQEKNTLQQTALELSESLKMDMVIVTADDNEGKTSREYADDFYDTNGFGYGENADGVLLLINMDDREVYISTSGAAINTLTDSRIESTLDAVYTHLNSEAYGEGAAAFLETAASYIHQGTPSAGNALGKGETGQLPATQPQGVASPVTQEEGRLGDRLPIYLLISLAIGGVSVGVMAMNNRGTSTTNATTYLDHNSFDITERYDRHVNTTVTHVKINTNSGGSGTHTSSSGRSHGGGGRKF